MIQLKNCTQNLGHKIEGAVHNIINEQSHFLIFHNI